MIVYQYSKYYVEFANIEEDEDNMCWFPLLGESYDNYNDAVAKMKVTESEGFAARILKETVTGEVS